MKLLPILPCLLLLGQSQLVSAGGGMFLSSGGVCIGIPGEPDDVTEDPDKDIGDETEVITDLPVAAPTDPPVASPTDSPVAAPTDSPLASPTEAPVGLDPNIIVTNPDNLTNPDTGFLATLWDSKKQSLEESSCRYLAFGRHSLNKNEGTAPANATTESWLDPYISMEMYCAVPKDIFEGGALCGKCVQLVASWPTAIPPELRRVTAQIIGHDRRGEPGAVVFHEDDADDGPTEFQCGSTVLNTLTPSSAGSLSWSKPIGVQYDIVDCPRTQPAMVVVVHGKNAWYVKVLVVGGPGAALAVTMDLVPEAVSGNETMAPQTYPLGRARGAYWNNTLPEGISSTPEENVKVVFTVMYDSGEIVRIDNNCFGGQWPVPAGSECSV